MDINQIVYMSQNQNRNSIFRDSYQSSYSQKSKERNHKIKDHTIEYKQYFMNVQQTVNQKIFKCNNSEENKIKHKIINMNKENNLSNLINFNQARVLVIGTQCNGLIIKYQVLIGNFKISIDMINLITQAPNTLKVIGKGTYGQIYKILINKVKNIVCKRTKFIKKTIIWPQNQQGEEIRQTWQIKPNLGQIHQTILEYSIYKICSFYQIGPSTVDCMGFDLACFNDAIEFYMQHCDPQSTCGNYEDELKICVRILHKMKIIHKDIKPSNILYSSTHQSYVLTDFGISHPVQEQPGQLTQTYRQGTLTYMSPELLQLGENKSGLIDLYYNDLFGLHLSLMDISEQKIFVKQQNHKKIKKRFDLQYMRIKLIFMVLNSNIQETIQFIKEYVLYQMFFQQMKYLQNHSVKYIKIQQSLLKTESILAKYHQTKSNQQTIFSNKKLEIQQIQFMIRAYGITHQLLYELDRYEQNWRIKQIVKFQNNIGMSMRIISNQQLKITAKQLWFIKSQEKWLNARRNFISQCNIEQYSDIIDASFTIFNFYIQFPMYYEYAKSIYQNISQQQKQLYCTQQKVQYQMMIITLQLINHGEKNDQHCNERILQLFEKYPQETYLNYYLYFKLGCSINMLTSLIIQKYNIAIEQFKKVKFKYTDQNHMKEMIQIKLKMAQVYLQRNYYENSLIIIKQLQQILKQYHFQNTYCIELRFLQGKHYLKTFRFNKAVKIFQQLDKLIRQNQGENSYKLLLCKIELSKSYLLLKQFEKAETLSTQCIQQISQFYGQNNQDYMNCLLILIQVYINSVNVKKVIMYYLKWDGLINKIYTEQNLNRFNLTEHILKFYYSNGLNDKMQKLISQIQQKYKSKSPIKHLYYLMKTAHYHYIKFNFNKQRQIRIQISEQVKLIFKQTNLFQMQYLYAINCYNCGKQYYQQAQRKYNFIISNTQKDFIYHIQSIFKIGNIKFKNKDYNTAYQYFEQALKLLIQSQIDSMDMIISYKLLKTQCLVEMKQYDRAFKILLQLQQMSETINNSNYYRVKYLITKCYFRFKKINISKKLLISLMTQIKFAYPNIKQLCIQNEGSQDNKNHLTYQKYTAIIIYTHIIEILSSIYQTKKMWLHAIYYDQFSRSFTKSKTFYQKQSVYTIFYQVYRKKKQRALKVQLQQLENKISNLCYKHRKLIQFYSKCRAKTIILILLTFLLEKVCKCERSLSFLSFYQLYEKGFKYRICNEIVKTGKVSVTSKQKISMRLKKIALLKKVQYINRKLKLNHKLQPQNKFTDLY